MAISQPRIVRLTQAEFEVWAFRPENAERMWELIDGETVEKMPSNPYSS